MLMLRVMGRVDASSTSPATASAQWKSSALVTILQWRKQLWPSDDLKDEGIVAFVTLIGRESSDDLINSSGPCGQGDRSNRAARWIAAVMPAQNPQRQDHGRILRALAAGQDVTGDTSTLEDRSVLDRLRA